MADVRTPRDLVSREKTARKVYQPASSLPEPLPQPGFTFRWISTHVLGQPDPSNVSKKLREGWEPCKASDHPEMEMFANKSGNIEIGGLILAKMPEELAQSRTAYYANQSTRQMESVDNHFMKENDPRMPLFNDRKSTVSKGRGFGNGS
jgi:hypothetical protein